MRGVSKANLMCIRCQRTFTDRTGATVKHGLFKCAECSKTKPQEK